MGPLSTTGVAYSLYISKAAVIAGDKTHLTIIRTCLLRFKSRAFMRFDGFLGGRESDQARGTQMHYGSLNSYRYD